MDPNECLRLAEAALAAANLAMACDRLRDYYEWRLGGGFQPPLGDTKAGILMTRLSIELADRGF